MQDFLSLLKGDVNPQAVEGLLDLAHINVTCKGKQREKTVSPEKQDTVQDTGWEDDEEKRGLYRVP